MFANVCLEPIHFNYLTVIQRLKIQSESSIQKVVSRLTQVQCEITDDNGDDSTSEVEQKLNQDFISEQLILILQNLLHGFFLQSSFLFLYLFSILVHCSKTRVNMV